MAITYGQLFDIIKEYTQIVDYRQGFLLLFTIILMSYLKKAP